MSNIDLFMNNFFLKKLYPDGINFPILINNIKGSLLSYSELGIFIKTPPSIEVRKWGKWGEEYNCLYADFSINLPPKKLIIKNMEYVDYQNVSIRKDDDGFIEICAKGDNWEIFFCIEHLVFQKITPMVIDE